MIVLIRKWIAWVCVLVGIACFSVYWLIDELDVWQPSDAVQVMGSVTESSQIDSDLGSEMVAQEDTVVTQGALSESDNKTTEAVQSVDLANWQEEAAELKWQRNAQLTAEYDELKSMVQDLAEGELRTQAQQRMLAISEAFSLMEQAESMLKLKGYEAVVFIEGEQISAVVDKELAIDDGIIIAELLERVSGFAKENVLVIPR